MRKRHPAALTVLALVTGLTVTAGAGAVAAAETQIHVDNRPGRNCDDGGTGTQAQPYCTIGAAMAVVEPGQIVNVTGAYNEHVTIARSGTPDSPITMRGVGVTTARLSGETAGLTIDSQHDIRVVGLVITGGSGSSGPPGVSIVHSSRIRLESVSVTTGPWPVGFALAGVSDSSLVKVSVRGSRDGVTLDQSTTGVVVDGGFFFAPSTNEGDGIAVRGSHNVVRNVSDMRDFGGAQIRVGPGAADNVIVNNTIGWVSNPRSGAIYNIDASGTAITNNTIKDYCAAGIRVAGTSTGVSVQNNLVATMNRALCDPTVGDKVDIGIYDAAVNTTIVDYNGVDRLDTRPYAWGTPLTSLAAFQAASGQGAHEVRYIPRLSDSEVPDLVTVDSANSAAPFWPSTDNRGRIREDIWWVANTGPGPVTYADRGATEFCVAPFAQLTVTATQRATMVTADASASMPGGAPIATYTFDFGDGAVVTQSTPVATHAYSGLAIRQITLTVTDVNGLIDRETATVGPGSLFTPLSPIRVLDTRARVGVGTTTPVPAQGTIILPVAGRNGVPATGISAVVLNVTVTAPTAPGALTVYPDGQPMPTSSNLNWIAGETIPNLVTVPVTNGSVAFRNRSPGTVHLVADIFGYYAEVGASGYAPLGPVRVLDTRKKVGVGTTTPVPAGGVVSLLVTGRVGVPATGVMAVALNVTVTAPSAGGSLTVYPDSPTPPLVSNLNWTAGKTIANLVIVEVRNGRVDFYNRSAGTVHVLADLAGYFAANTGASFHPVGPVRVMDTRISLGSGTVSAGGTVVLPVSSSAMTLPPNVSAVVINVTATRQWSPGYLTVYPDGQPRPTASNINWTANQTIPNLVVVPVMNGRIAFYNGSPGTIDLVADLFGYYVP